MPNMPKYVLKQKRLSKTKTVVIFRRNYLDTKNFKKENEGWVFEETFNHHGIEVYFKIIIHNENIFSMYEVDTKSMKIRGKHNSFGVFIRLPRQNTPFEADGSVGCAEYILKCSGRSLAYDNGKGIGNTRNAKSQVSTIHSGSRTPVNIPSSVSWSTSHPFQGGGVSPK